MATVVFTCDTCKREIELLENQQGLTVFGNCIITEGCRGTLFKTSRNQDNFRSNFPSSVSGLQDFIPRRAFFDFEQSIRSQKWEITHNMGISPAVSVFFFDSNGDPFEVDPNEYTITVVDQFKINIEFDSPESGVAHLVARSTIPEDVDFTEEAVNLIRITDGGILTFAVPKLITSHVPTPTPTSSFPIDLINEDVTVKISVELPSKEIITKDEQLKDDLQDSPWFGWNEIIIRKRRNYSTKTVSILDLDAFSNFSSLDDIPNGTRIRITHINYGDGEQPVPSRGLMLLYATEPFETFDKVQDKLIDVGELKIANFNYITIQDGEAYIHEENIEKVYPEIDRVFRVPSFSPTPTPSVTPTLTPTPTVTATVTQTPQPTFTPTPSATQGSTPTPTPTNSATPTVTPSNTPVVSATPTPTVTPTPSPQGISNITLTDKNAATYTDNTSSDTKAAVKLYNDGRLSVYTFGNEQFTSGEWGTPVGFGGGDYEVKLDKDAGDDPFGDSLGVWLSLGTTREWFHAATTVGTTKSFEGTMRIRRVSDGTVLDTANIVITSSIIGFEYIGETDTFNL